MQNIGLRMNRSDLENLPTAPLLEGFHFRTYRHADCEAWVQVYDAAEAHVEITPELFDREFYGDEAALAERMLFLFDAEGTAVGTSTAWYDDIGHRSEVGRVHWVAIRPTFQGRGLGAALLAQTLITLQRLGHSSAYLLTSSARIPALSMYIRFGFVPDIESEEQHCAWQEVAEQLRPELCGPINQSLKAYPGQSS